MYNVGNVMATLWLPKFYAHHPEKVNIVEDKREYKNTKSSFDHNKSEWLFSEKNVWHLWKCIFESNVYYKY